MKLFERESTPAEDVEVALEEAPVVPEEPDEALTPHGIVETTDPSVAKEPSGGSLSVIGQSLVIRGELEAAEDMLVEGRLEGSIKHTANRLTIGAAGVVHADIDARNLVIEGTVEGNVVGSESVVIRETAIVRGNVHTARISISDGARFSGRVDMDLSGSPRH